jgi:hypothetical protein
MPSNTVVIAKQPATFANFSVEKRGADPFTIREDRYVGQDGFVVPTDFDEFYKRFPQYVRNWVRRHADGSARPEDIEDWTQDLLLHLKSLPPTSKYRKMGKQDVVQTFDPSRHYGASQPRFQNYINLCLSNKFRTMHSARQKNPLFRPGNLSLSEHVEGEEWVHASDEYCHSHSEQLRNSQQIGEKQRQDRFSILEFASFVHRTDSKVLPVLRAMYTSETKAEALGSLQLTEYRFLPICDRLRELARFYADGDPRMGQGQARED